MLSAMEQKKEILADEREINQALATYKLIKTSDIQNSYNAYQEKHNKIFCGEQYLEKFYEHAKKAYRDAQKRKDKSDSESIKMILHGLKKVGYGAAFSKLAMINYELLSGDQQLKSLLPSYYLSYITGICAFTALNFVLSGLWKTYKGMRYRSKVRHNFELALQNKSNIAFGAHSIISQKFLNEKDNTKTPQEEKERLLYLQFIWRKRIGILPTVDKKNGKENNEQNSGNQSS